MSRVLLDTMIETSYGQLDLILDDDSFGFEGDMQATFAGQANGLVGAAQPGYAYITLAGWGGGHVKVVLSESEPTVDDSWEDVVEVSIVVPEGSPPRLSTWAGESEDPLDIGPGSYRLRVSAKDRDQGHQDESSGSYLLDVWPAPPTSDAVVKITSANARYWQSENGSTAP